MHLIPTRALKVGMRLAQPVFHPKRDDFVLLGKGHLLTEEWIERLGAIGTGHVWTRFAALQAADEKVHRRVLERHCGLYDVLRKSIPRIRNRIAIEANVGLYHRNVEGLLFEIIASPQLEAILAPLSAEALDLSGHMANVAYLSLLLGAHLAGYLRTERCSALSSDAEETRALGIGALLHDIGKLEIDEAFRGTCVLDADSDDEEYRAHTAAGYERVLGRIPGAAANVLLNHHQRINGLGFPDRFDHITKSTREPPTGARIHVFSRIAAVADIFDNLLQRAGDDAPTVVVLHALQSRRFERWFDPTVVETLIRLVPPFTVGTVVRLSTGRDAVVMANPPRNPCQPIVKIVHGSVHHRGTRTERGVVDLRHCPHVHIQAVGGRSVARYLFEPLESQPTLA